MLYMNDYDIDLAIQRHPAHTAAGRAARLLANFREQVNSVSDGWAYWRAPLLAARRMMELAQRPPIDPGTDADYRAALTPIRAFMTRKGRAAGIILPEVTQ